MKKSKKNINEVKTNSKIADISKMYIKQDSKEYKIKAVSLSPKKVHIKKRFSQIYNRSNSISNNNKEVVAKKKFGLFGPNKSIDLNIVKNLDKKNRKFMEELSIINKNNKLRDKNEKECVINFLIKNNFRETVIDDLEYFGINIKKYINLILDYISLKEYGYLDIIYYDKDTPNNFYYILNDTNIGEYCLDITEDNIDFENYLLYLNDLFILYEKYKEKKIFLQKINLEQKEEQSTFIDSYLIKKIINENNKTYYILSFNDIKEAKEIIIQSKIYNLITQKENEGNYIDENDNSIYNEDIIQIHKDYNANLSLLNYDKVISEDMSFKRFIYYLKNSILSDSSSQYYLRMINNHEKNIIKKINYKKIKNYKKFEYFGNFPLPMKNKNFEPRNFISRSESISTLVLCFNKGEYYNSINSILKEENERNLNFFHEEYIFKVVNMEYFTKKIFKDFKLINNSKGDIIFSQNQKNNNFIMLKEGIIELQMTNISLSELGQKITYIKDILIKKIKEYKYTNKLADQVYELEMDKKTNLPMNFIKELINKKMNITFSKCTRGFFGEYECFFNIPSLLTGIVVSENSEEYFYSYEQFKDLNNHTTSLNEKLEEYSFNKLINLLKRMFNIYNSYWRILNNQYSNLIDEEDNDNNNQKINFNNINNYDAKINYNNTENYDEDYYKIDNYKKLSNKNDEMPKLKISNQLMSKTIFGKKIKEIITNNMESIKYDKLIIKNKISQVKSKKIKKFHIKNWDFVLNQNNYDSINSERLKSKYLNNINFNKNIKKILPENDKNKIIDIAKSSIINNNFIKSKINQINNRRNKSNKINKKILNNIILPPISKKNENNNDINNISNLKNLQYKRNYNNLEIELNDDNEQNSDNNYLYPYTDKKSKINFDVKKVSINFLKSRKKKFNVIDNDDNDLLFEEYYFTNQ